MSFVRLVKQPLIAAAVGCALVLGAGPVAAGDQAKGQAADQMKWGYQAAKRGYWLEALNRFEKANQLTPNQPRILNNIAVALEASGRFDEALVAYESALGVAPNDKVLRGNFARFREFYDTQVNPKPETAKGEQGAKGPAEAGGAPVGDTGEDDDA